MDALFGLQQSEGVPAADFDFRGFDPRLLTLEKVEHLHFETVALRPAGVHAHQHLGPILRFRAAGTGVNREEGVAAVVGAAEHVLELEGLELGLDLLGFRFEGPLQCQVDLRLGFQQLRQIAPLIHALAKIVVGLEPPLQRLDFLDRGARLLLVRPQSPIRHDVLELTEPASFPIDVKESSEVR